MRKRRLGRKWLGTPSHWPNVPFGETCRSPIAYRPLPGTIRLQRAIKELEALAFQDAGEIFNWNYAATPRAGSDADKPSVRTLLGRSRSCSRPAALICRRQRRRPRRSKASPSTTQKIWTPMTSLEAIGLSASISHVQVWARPNLGKPAPSPRRSSPSCRDRGGPKTKARAALRARQTQSRFFYEISV